MEIILLKKKLKKFLDFQEVTYFFTSGIATKIRAQICRNSFSRRNKYVHVSEVDSTSSLNFLLESLQLMKHF